MRPRTPGGARPAGPRTALVWLLVALAVAAPVAWSVGCGGATSSGGEGSGGTDAAVEAAAHDAGVDGPLSACPPFREGRVTTGHGACDTCLATSCCALTVACFDDAECVALNDCVGRCVMLDAGGDAQANVDCASACYASRDAATAPYDAFIACFQGACAASCP